MSGLWDGIGKVFGKISEQFQGRIERLKNEDSALRSERAKLLQGECNEKVSRRVTVIDKRLSELHELLKNSAKG